VYTPYGHRTVGVGLPALSGYKGESPDSLTGNYLLGNGHRAYNPPLMRFNSPDSLSPFGEGGVNCYAYCGGDPINRTDPSGKTWYGWAWFTNSALGMVDDYLIPRIPKRLVRQLPLVANRTFGEVTKSMRDVGGFAASVLYLGMNRFEAYYPDSSFNDPFFYTFLTTSTFAVANASLHTLHKLALRKVIPVLPSTRPTLERSASLPDLRRHTVPTTNSSSTHPRMQFQRTELAEQDVHPNATWIRHTT
jgi:RHS repeat-associated protein